MSELIAAMSRPTTIGSDVAGTMQRRLGRVVSMVWMAVLATVATVSVAEVEAAPARLETAQLADVGTRVALQASGCNRAMTIHVMGATVHERYAGWQPPVGHRWLVLDARIENWMPVDLVLGHGYQEALLIASVTRQLYLLVDGQRVYRAATIGDGLLEENFILPEIGAAREGRLVYPVPAEDVRSLSLRYYHDEYAPVVVPLLGTESAPTVASEPAFASAQENELIAIGIQHAEIRSEWQGQRAPPGMAWAVVDVRGRALWSITADAVALDRQAASGRVPLPKVMEYVQAEGLLQVVVDGSYGYVRDFDLSSIPRDPAFLPDAWAGGIAVFPVPADAQSIELVAHFPQFRGPGMRTQIPETMRFTLREGAHPVDAAPLLEIADQPTPFAVHDARYVDEYAGHHAGDGVLLVLDASMRNVSDVGGMMQVTHRVRLVDAAGDNVEPLAVHQRGPLVLEQPFWLPAGGESRRFTLLYRIDEPLDVLPLRYGGVSVNETVELRIPAR